MRIGIRGFAGLLAGCIAVAMLAVVGRPSAASAHPLGNFTINHYDRVEVSDSGITVFSVLDMAEIPAFRERQGIDVNGDGAVDDAEAGAYAASKADELRSNLELKVNGAKASLRGTAHELTFPAGQGGLSLLRLTATYEAALPDGWRDNPPKVQFADNNDADRLGWREIVVRAGAGVQLGGSSVASEDVSAELTSYPQDSLSSPLDVRSATFSFEPGTGVAAPSQPDRQVRAVRGNPDSTLSRFAGLISKRDLSFGAIALALLAAAAFGAVHALSPGHGKTIVGAYLVGSRGTAKHALLLGLTVTATHTSMVYAVGFVTLYLERFILPEDLYPWLSVASGALIVSMGLALFVSRAGSAGLWGVARRFASRHAQRAPAPRRVVALPFEFAMASADAGVVAHRSFGSSKRVAHQHDGSTHTGDDHAHNDEHHTHDAHAHSHGFGAHTHRMPGEDGEPVSWRSLIGLGIFGGLLPCPTAIVVMLSAISLHRVGFGLVLIMAFSAGLAAVLTGIGFALVFARTLPHRFGVVRRVGERANGRMATLAVRAVPVGSALAVVAAGAVVILRALSQQGWV